MAILYLDLEVKINLETRIVLIFCRKPYRNVTNKVAGNYGIGDGLKIVAKNVACIMQRKHRLLRQLDSCFEIDLVRFAKIGVQPLNLLETLLITLQ